MRMNAASGVVLPRCKTNFEIRLTFFLLYFAQARNPLTFQVNYGTIGGR